MAGVLLGDFDAEEIVVGRGGGGRLQEQSFAAADFDFERRFATKSADGVPRLRQLVPRLEVAGEVERRIKFAESAAGHGERIQDSGSRSQGNCSKSEGSAVKSLND